MRKDAATTVSGENEQTPAGAVAIAQDAAKTLLTTETDKAKPKRIFINVSPA